MESDRKFEVAWAESDGIKIFLVHLDIVSYSLCLICLLIGVLCVLSCECGDFVKFLQIMSHYNFKKITVVPGGKVLLLYFVSDTNTLLYSL